MSALATARDSDRPILLHIGTVKGKGFKPAEDEPDRWHGVGPFDPATAGQKQTAKPSKPGYSACFGMALTALADADTRIAAITAAMRSGTGLDTFATAHPDRFFDVGICEEHAVTFAAGLAVSGQRPFVALYSTFAHRAVDNTFHDVCLQNLPVTLCLDRAGVVGADGPTHHGLYDIPLFRDFPNIVIMQPRDEVMVARMLKTALAGSSPCVIRYPRGRGPGLDLPAAPEPLELGKAEVLKSPAAPAKIWIWALGDMIGLAEKTADILEAKGLAAGIVDPRFIKPIDKTLLISQAQSGATFVTIENGVLAGGFGSLVLETLSDAGCANSVKRFGWPDKIIGQGTQDELFADYGLTPEKISADILG